MIATSSKFIIEDDIITLYVVQYVTYTINKECHSSNKESVKHLQSPSI